MQDKARKQLISAEIGSKANFQVIQRKNQANQLDKNVTLSRSNPARVQSILCLPDRQLTVDRVE